MYIIDKPICDNPYENLAYEQCLMEVVKEENVPILFLWQNENVIVLGRNQNLYKECDLGFVQNNNIKIARRKSGGGAVFQDVGNLNYSFVCKESVYDREKVFAIICKSLNELGIDCVVGGRNDLYANGYKVSGTAFFKKGDVVLHHGSILVDADIEKMTNCLTPNKIKLKTKGIASVAERVLNLKQIAPKVTIENLKQMLKKFFIEVYGESNIELMMDSKMRDAYESFFASEEFIIGNSSLKYETLGKSFPWGTIDFRVQMTDGIILECVLESDALWPDLLLEIEKSVKNESFANLVAIKTGVLEVVHSNEEKRIVEDIFCFLEGTSGGNV